MIRTIRVLGAALGAFIGLGLAATGTGLFTGAQYSGFILAAWTIATVRVVITHWYRSGADAALFAAGRDALLALSRDMGARASIDLVGAPAPDHGSGRAK